MKVGNYCKHSVSAVESSADIAEAARIMRENHVGFLVVFEAGDPLHKPIGVITDRDIVLQVTACDADPHSLTVEDVMTRQPLTALEHDEIGDLVQAMRMSGIRRVPIVDTRGALTGIIALDDLIDVIATLVGEVAGSIKSEQREEWRARPML